RHGSNDDVAQMDSSEREIIHEKVIGERRYARAQLLSVFKNFEDNEGAAQKKSEREKPRGAGLVVTHAANAQGDKQAARQQHQRIGEADNLVQTLAPMREHLWGLPAIIREDEEKDRERQKVADEQN